MADPVWTADYDTNETPESNNYTRRLVRSPIITETRTGNPVDKNIQINSDIGDGIFLISTVPSLTLTSGATIEAIISVSGRGDAGIELTFLDCAILVNIFENLVNLSIPSGTDEPNGQGNPVLGQEIDIATVSNNARIKWRVTIDDSRVWRVYRDGLLIGGPITTHFIVKPFQRVLWWGEGGGIQTFYSMKYYIGGAEAP